MKPAEQSLSLVAIQTRYKVTAFAEHVQKIEYA